MANKMIGPNPDRVVFFIFIFGVRVQVLAISSVVTRAQAETACMEEHSRMYNVYGSTPTMQESLSRNVRLL